MTSERTPTTFLGLDIVLLLSVLGLVSLGIAFIYSSGVTSEGIQVSNEWMRQIIWSGSGILLMAVFALVDYRRWRQWAPAFYAGGLILLVLVLLVGNYVKGARAWLGVGSVGVQPSEFGKLALIIMLARWFEDGGRGQDAFRVWVGAILITVVPLVLVLIQPDLGTAVVYIPILLAMAFVAGVDWSLLLFPLAVGALIIVGVLGLAWSEYIAVAPSGFFRLFTEGRYFRIAVPALAGLTALALAGWFIFRRKVYLPLLYGFGIATTGYLGIAAAARALRGYQMMRLVVFLDPQIDPRGAGWHIIQSVTAVGSGGLMGKGFLQGTQSHYRYLPEQSTDFIFSILAEETGFLGSLLVFALFALELLLRL